MDRVVCRITSLQRSHYPRKMACVVAASGRGPGGKVWRRVDGGGGASTVGHCFEVCRLVHCFRLSEPETVLLPLLRFCFRLGGVVFGDANQQIYWLGS